MSEESSDHRQIPYHLTRAQQEELLVVLQDTLARPPTVAEARAAKEAALLAGASYDAADAVALAVAAVVRAQPTHASSRLPQLSQGVPASFSEERDYHPEAPVEQRAKRLRKPGAQQKALSKGEALRAPRRRQDPRRQAEAQKRRRQQKAVPVEDDDDDEDRKWPIARRPADLHPILLKPSYIGGNGALRAEHKPLREERESVQEARRQARLEVANEEDYEYDDGFHATERVRRPPMKPATNTRLNPRVLAENASMAAAAAPRAQQGIYGAPVRGGGRIPKKLTRYSEAEKNSKKHRAPPQAYPPHSQLEPGGDYLETSEVVRKPRKPKREAHLSKPVADSSPPKNSRKANDTQVPKIRDSAASEVELLSMLHQLSPQRRAKLLSALEGTEDMLRSNASNIPAREVGLLAHSRANVEAKFNQNTASPERIGAHFRSAVASRVPHSKSSPLQKATELNAQREALVQRMAEVAQTVTFPKKKIKFEKIPMDMNSFRKTVKETMDVALTFNEVRILARIVDRRAGNYIVWNDFMAWFRKNGGLTTTSTKASTENEDEKDTRRRRTGPDLDASVEVFIDPMRRLGMEIDSDNFVMRVLPEGQAERFGLQVGYYIDAADGCNVSTLDELKNILGEAKANKQRSLKLHLVQREQSAGEILRADEGCSIAKRNQSYIANENEQRKIQALRDEHDAAVLLQGMARGHEARTRTKLMRQGHRGAGNFKRAQSESDLTRMSDVTHGSFESDDEDDVTSMSGDQIQIVSAENWTKETDATNKVARPTDWGWKGSNPKLVNNDLEDEGDEAGDQIETQDTMEDLGVTQNASTPEVAHYEEIVEEPHSEQIGDNDVELSLEEHVDANAVSPFATLKTIPRLKAMRKSHLERKAIKEAHERAVAAAEALNKQLEAEAGARAAEAIKEQERIIREAEEAAAAARESEEIEQKAAAMRLALRKEHESAILAAVHAAMLMKKRLRNKQERDAKAAKAAREEQEAAEKAARDAKKAAEKAARDAREAAEKAAREEREAAEKAARDEKEAAEKAARDAREAAEEAARDAQEAKDERVAAEKTARDKQEAAEKAARDEKEEAEKAAREERELAEKAARKEREAAEKVARDEREAAEKAARDELEAAEKAAREEQEAAAEAARASNLEAKVADDTLGIMQSQKEVGAAVKNEVQVYFESKEGKVMLKKRIEGLKEEIMDELVSEAFDLDGAKDVLSRHFLKSSDDHVQGKEEVISELVLASLLKEWIGEAGFEDPKTSSQKKAAVERVALWLFEEG